MTLLKYPLVMIVLAGWFAEEFVSDRLLRFAVAAAYSLAILFLSLSALIRRPSNEEPTFRIGMKYLPCGPAALAAIISVGTTIISLKHRDFCNIIDCFSLNAFSRFHLPHFVSDFTAVSLRFYTIFSLAMFLARMIQTIQKL
jgi:hypothetical protein